MTQSLSPATKSGRAGKRERGLKNESGNHGGRYHSCVNNYNNWGSVNSHWEDGPVFCSLWSNVSLSVFPVTVLNFQKASYIFFLFESRPSINNG